MLACEGALQTFPWECCCRGPCGQGCGGRGVPGVPQLFELQDFSKHLCVFRQAGGSWFNAGENPPFDMGWRWLCRGCSPSTALWLCSGHLQKGWDMGGECWLPPECLGSATLAASAGSAVAFKLDHDRNTFLSSASVLFCFYFLILFSSAFLEMWWEEKGCTCPGAELQLQGGSSSFRSNACKRHSENYFYLAINFMLALNKKTGLCVGSVWYFPAFTNIICFLYLPPCVSRCGLFILWYWLLRIKSDLPDVTKQKGCIFFM